MRTKIRFHLAAGENFGKWQIKNESATLYVDPQEKSLILKDVILANRPTTARRIFEGGSAKTVCAWLDVGEFQIVDPPSPRRGRYPLQPPC